MFSEAQIFKLANLYMVVISTSVAAMSFLGSGAVIVTGPTTNPLVYVAAAILFLLGCVSAMMTICLLQPKKKVDSS